MVYTVVQTGAACLARLSFPNLEGYRIVGIGKDRKCYLIGTVITKIHMIESGYTFH